MSTKGQILIIDDEKKLRELFKRIISIEGYTVYECEDIHTASRFITRQQIDVILCDVCLPDGNGIEFIKQVKEQFPYVEIILFTAFGNVNDGVQAMKNGAFDYIIKGIDNDKLMPLLNQAMQKVVLHKKAIQSEKKLHSSFSFDNIIGESNVLIETIQLAKKVADTDTTVLLLGETGTGKELFAQAIHYNSKRAAMPFLAFNCSAFPKELLESELFGHKAGSFTGASKNKKGLLEEAEGGTIFLDEIGEMNIELQAKILRFLETGEFIKIGDGKPTKINVRIISATNRNLDTEVVTGYFRQDLLYRLNGFTIRIPPLRERGKDIIILSEVFIKMFATKINKHIIGMNKECKKALQLYLWKGNVRELKNVIERAVLMCEFSELSAKDLPREIQLYANQPNTVNSFYDLKNTEKIQIQRVLEITKGNRAEAAKMLNIGLATLYRKISLYHLDKIDSSFC